MKDKGSKTRIRMSTTVQTTTTTSTHKLDFITVYLHPAFHASAGLHEFRKDKQGAQHHDKTGKDEYDEQFLVPLLVRFRFGELFEALLDADLGLLHIVVDSINQGSLMVKQGEIRG